MGLALLRQCDLFVIGKSRGSFAGYEGIATATIQGKSQQLLSLFDDLEYAVLRELAVMSRAVYCGIA